MSQNNNRDRQADPRALVVQPPRLPMPKEALASGLTEGSWRVLVEAKFPAAQSVNGVMLAVEYARSRGLDIMKSVVHVVPMWSSSLGKMVETVWPGIAELRTTAARTGQWAGNDEVAFGPTQTKEFVDKQVKTKRGSGETYTVSERCEAFDWPLWAQMTQYKIVAGQRVAFVGPKVLFTETFSGEKGLAVPNSMWRKRPFGQLEKCAEAASLRRAFPEEIGDQWTAEEMEGKQWQATSDEPPVQAVINAEPVNHDAPEQEQEQAAGRGENAADWSDAHIDEYVAEMDLACSTAQTLQDLDDDWAKNAVYLDFIALPAYDKVREMFAVHAKRLKDGKTPAKAKGEQLEPVAEQDDQVVARSDQVSTDSGNDGALSDEQIMDYRSKLAKIILGTELLVDLDAREKAEVKSINALPESDKEICISMFADRRREISRSGDDTDV